MGSAPLYPPLRRKFHDAESERHIRDLWREHGTFAASIRRREGAPDFVFYEGPPTANGLPGVHHVMARLCKDLVCRHRTMAGFRVLRKAGWDTHGLPVERAVEKRLGIQGRQQIEEYGIAAFNEECRKSVWSCKADWDEFTDRIGYWLDLEHPYITYENEYIESVWWILSRFGEAGLLYQGQKVVPYCPTCGTPLSSHETAAGYREITEPSIYVELEAADGPERFLTWTTTPWTLPSNVALAVGPEHDYVRVRHGGRELILAEARLGVLPAEVPTEVLQRFKGRDLVGRRYRPLLPYLQPPAGRRAFEVVAADFVTLDAGSGIVHIAPAFGEDDFQVGQREGLAVFEPVDAAGRFTAEVPPYAGLHVKEADPRIVEDLRRAGRLLAVEPYKHDYPFHDRCGSPLIYYATPSWFIRTSALREQLLQANRDIRWVPPETGEARFGNWLESNVDWALSRNRYWGTPLNVWICDRCGERRMPTSREELSRLTGRDLSGLDLHRPYVDEIVLPCAREGCGGSQRRTPEVIDCWFDSGSMPYAQYHYPFENRELFENQFPAAFISEGVDQTRGWFYTMLAISTFLSGRSSYQSCLPHDLILDRNGKKMSKSLGNTVDPREILKDEGADPLRWYLITSSPVWVPTRFDREGVKEAQRKLLATLENTYAFFALYANLDGWRPGDERPAAPDLLDRWILSRLGSVAAAVSADLEELNLTRAAKALGSFLIDDVSNWYVRLSRRRFWQGEIDPDKQAAFATLHRVLVDLLRLLAPFVPFTTEEIWRALHADDPAASVHLEDWPQPAPALQDERLEARMATAQEIVSLGRALRQDARLRTRQPLGRLRLHSEDGRIADLLADARLAALVAEELNVKRVDGLVDPRQAIRLEARANFRALGPRFGKRAQAVGRRIQQMTADEIMELRRAGTVGLEVEGTPAELGFEEIEVRVGGVEPYVAAAANGLTVALDTTLTDELVDEGIYREIVSKVQNLRKRSGLEVSDRIQLSVTGSERVRRVVASYGDRIARETLATALVPGADLPHRDESRIDDQEVLVALARSDPGPGGQR